MLYYKRCIRTKLKNCKVVLKSSVWHRFPFSVRVGTSFCSLVSNLHIQCCLVTFSHHTLSLFLSDFPQKRHDTWKTMQFWKVRLINSSHGGVFFFYILCIVVVSVLYSHTHIFRLLLSDFGFMDCWVVAAQFKSSNRVQWKTVFSFCAFPEARLKGICVWLSTSRSHSFAYRVFCTFWGGCAEWIELIILTSRQQKS